MIWIALALIALSPFIAHLVGRPLARAITPEPGRAASVMPTLPDHDVREGRAEARFERRRRRAEQRFLERYAKDGTQGLDARGLATALDEEIEVAEALLGHLREELPVRLQVTGDGRLLHDFAAADLETLRGRRRSAWPLRVGIAVLGVLANIGAAWPVLLVGAVAAGTLTSMLGVESLVEALFAGFKGLGVILISGGVAWGLGQVVGGVLRARRLNAPRLGSALRAEAAPVGSDPALLTMLGGGREEARFEGPLTRLKKKFDGMMRGKKNKSDKDSGSPVEALQVLEVGEGCLPILVIGVVLLLAALLSEVLLLVYFWGRSVVRALMFSGEVARLTSPGRWTRTSHRVDAIERWMPMNDLVFRMFRGISRTLSHAQPFDGELGGRLLVAAREREGRLSVLEIQRFEALDFENALAIGARLVSRLEGRMHVTEDGEIEFVFPLDALRDLEAIVDPDAGAEYITFLPKIERRSAQRRERLPVNIVGLEWRHLTSGAALVGGTLMMAIVGLIGAASVTGGSTAWMLLLTVVLPLMFMGTLTLSTAARYVARASAANGVRRDLRRALCATVELRRAQGDDAVHLGGLSQRFHRVFQAAWPKLEFALVHAEVEAAAMELGLEMDIESGDSDRYLLAPLHRRVEALDAARRARAERSEAGRVEDAEDEEVVVYDTRRAVGTSVRALY